MLLNIYVAVLIMIAENVLRKNLFQKIKHRLPSFLLTTFMDFPWHWLSGSTYLALYCKPGTVCMTKQNFVLRWLFFNKN